MKLHYSTGSTETEFECEREVSHIIIQTNQAIVNEKIDIFLTSKQGDTQTLAAGIPLKALAQIAQRGEGANREEGTTEVTKGYYMVKIGHDGALMLGDTEKLTIKMESMAAAAGYTFYGLESLYRTKKLCDYSEIKISTAVQEELKQTTKLTALVADLAKVERVKLNYVSLLNNRAKSIAYNNNELEFLQAIGNDSAMKRVLTEAHGEDLTHFKYASVPLTPQGYYSKSIELTTNGATYLYAMQVRAKNETENNKFIAERALESDEAMATFTHG